VPGSTLVDHFATLTDPRSDHTKRHHLLDLLTIALCVVIQVLSATDARLALRHVAEAVRPGGTIYLINQVLDDSRLSPIDAVRTNLIFLNFYDGGQAYTKGEYRAWLTEAGFDDITLGERLGGIDLIRARKAG
jgi:hypothetical protein